VKHGGNGRRGWKKLHLDVDETGVIVASALTEPTADDATTGITLYVVKSIRTNAPVS
jgi:phage head maturation protease